MSLQTKKLDIKMHKTNINYGKKNVHYVVQFYGRRQWVCPFCDKMDAIFPFYVSIVQMV